jgi:PAS domain S-box-containing protein
MTRILIVEDESIVAKDVEKRLKSLGYTVCATVSSGRKALQKVEKEHPDLVLMDIVLKGDMDGIETAEKIRSRFFIPVVYVTAYAKEHILQRAKVTEPYGYILKPFQSRELRTVIETALYKHEMEQKIRKSEEWLSTILKSVGEGVIAVDTQGVITFMNPAAEIITGCTVTGAEKTLKDICVLQKDNSFIDITKVVKEGVFIEMNNVMLINKDKTIPVAMSASPIRDGKGITGVVLVFLDITDRIRAEKEKDELLHKLHERVKELSCLYRIEEIAKRNITGEQIFNEAVQIIPHSYQYPESAGCCIVFEGKEYKTENFEKTEWMQTAQITVGNTTGILYVCYGEKKPLADEGPFLKEEKKLINSIAIRLGEIVGRKKAEKALFESRLQLESLFEASKLINSTMDIDKVYEFISDSVQQLVGFDNFIIFLVSKKKDRVYPVYRSGVKKDVKDLVLLYGEGLIGQCIQRGEALLLENSHVERGLVKFTDMKSQIIVPLIVEYECVGVLLVSKYAAYAYTYTDVEVLKPLGEVISSALKNSQLYSEIKEFGKRCERRIKQRARRLEILLHARQQLQREMNWEKGLRTIVDSMKRLGFERCSIFLVDSLRKTLESHVKGVGFFEENVSISLTETEYFGVKCVLEKKTIHVKEYNPEEGTQIVESPSFVWVPIIVQDEAFAALAADSKEGEVITEEDVKDLELLAGMCASFIDRTRILVEPVVEPRVKTALTYWLAPAECCIVVEKHPEKSFDIVVDIVAHGVPGVILSRMHPEKVKRMYALVKTPVFWLSESGAKNTICPKDLSKLRYILENFTRKSKESIILLDGLEYLIVQNSFDSVLKFLYDIKDMVVLSNSRLVIPLHRETLTLGEFSALEKEFTIVDGDSYHLVQSKKMNEYKEPKSLLHSLPFLLFKGLNGRF